MDDFCDTIDISFDDLDRVSGGAGIDPKIWSEVQSKAGPYCPDTVAEYGSRDPATITPKLANKMADQCVAEMPWYAKGEGRKELDAGLATAFPKK